MQKAQQPSADNEFSEQELNSLLDSLSEESKCLVKIITQVINKQFKSEIDSLKQQLTTKDSEITTMQDEIVELKSKVQELETSIDAVDQYERRDTIIFSGPLVPDETRQENTTNLICKVVKDNLKINISEKEINIAHRLGPVNSQKTRPVIVKLGNRSLKHDLVGAYIQLKPGLFI